MLYGGALDPYVLVELFGRPLLKGLDQAFTLVLVNDRWFLNLRERIEKPVLFLRRQGAELASGTAQTLPSDDIISSPSGRFDPIVPETSSQHSADHESSLSSLQLMATYLDLLEPFDRVARAVTKVHEEKALDS